MSGLGAFLMGLIGPLATRVLLTLGLGVVSVTGLTAVLALVQQQIQNSFNGLPLDVASFIFMSGLPQSMAIILSALAARLSMMQLSKIQRLSLI